MNVCLQKQISFSAIHAKHKSSLDMLACVSKQLPFRRGNWLHYQKEITKNNQGRHKAVQLIFEMKSYHKQHERAILKYK